MGKLLGISALSTEMGNWNNGFDKLARRTSEGVVFATDKSRKYSIREDFKATQEDGFKVLITAEKDESGAFLNLENKLKKKKFLNKDLDKKRIIQDFIDIRLFGAVFAVSKGNTNLTGPLSIGFSLNTYYEGDNIIDNEFTYQIGSFTSGAEGKDKKTLGSENKLERAVYAYPFLFNPILYRENMKEFGAEEELIEEFMISDLHKFRDAIQYDATNMRSCFKEGTNNLFNIFIETKNDNDNINPMPLSKIQVREDKESSPGVNLISVNIDNIIDFVENNKDKIERVMIDYLKSSSYPIEFKNLNKLEKLTTVEINHFS